MVSVSMSRAEPARRPPEGRTAELSKLAVLACPGGASFASAVAGHLEHWYRRKFDDRCPRFAVNTRFTLFANG